MFLPLSILFLTKAMLPVANIPVIEHMLEYLYIYDVTEVIIVASRSYHAVDDYIQQSRFNSTHPSMRVDLILAPPDTDGECKLLQTVWESYFREKKIQSFSQFILFSCPTVCSFDLNKVMEAHRTRKAAARKRGDHIIMSMVCSQGAQSHRFAPPNNPQLLVTDRNDLLRHVELHGSSTSNLPISMFKRCRTLRARRDLVLANVFVAEVDLFTVNDPDLTQVTDIVEGVLQQYDTLQYDVAVDVQPGLAASINTFRSYTALNKAVLRRWFPQFLPEQNNMAPGRHRTKYRLTSDGYREDGNIRRARTGATRGNVMVGADTSVDGESVLERAIIGRNCCIWSQSQISDSVVMAGVNIRSGVTIKSSIICERSTVGNNATIGPDVVIGPDAVIPDNAVLTGPAVYLCTDDLTAISLADGHSDDDSERRGIGSRHARAYREREVDWGSMSTLESPIATMRVTRDSGRGTATQFSSRALSNLGPPGSPDLSGDLDVGPRSLESTGPVDILSPDLGTSSSDLTPPSSLFPSRTPSSASALSPLPSPSTQSSDIANSLARLDVGSTDSMPGPGALHLHPFPANVTAEALRPHFIAYTPWTPPQWLPYEEIARDDTDDLPLSNEDRLYALQQGVVGTVRKAIDRHHSPDDAAQSIMGLVCTYRTAEQSLIIETLAASVIALLSHFIEAVGGGLAALAEDEIMERVCMPFRLELIKWMSSTGMRKFFIPDGDDEDEFLYQILDLFTTDDSPVFPVFAVPQGYTIIQALVDLVTDPDQLDGIGIVSPETYEAWLEEMEEDEATPEEDAMQADELDEDARARRFVAILQGCYDDDSDDEESDEDDDEED